MRSIPMIAAVVAALCASPPSVAAAPSQAVDGCDPSGKLHVVVELSAPPPQPAAGVKMRLRYPAAVALPGVGEASSVKARVSELPSGFLASVNDQDGTLSVALASGTETKGSGTLFAVDFDRCGSAAAPGAGEFACEVEEAVQDCGAPAGDVHCSVKIQ